MQEFGALGFFMFNLGSSVLRSRVEGQRFDLEAYPKPYTQHDPYIPYNPHRV